MSSQVHSHLPPSGISPTVTLGLALVAFFYLLDWMRARSRFAGLMPVRRLAEFLCGLFAVWLAIGSPLVALDHQLLTIHMVKHLLLMTVAPPLILWGSPDLLRGFRRAAVNPVICWLSATGVVIGWHLPAAFQLALSSQAWHAAEQTSFLAAGFLFWLPVMQPSPGAKWDRWSVPVYLFLATIPCDILSAFLVFCGRIVYPSYAGAPAHFNLTPIQDQEFAGALMWVSVTLIYMIPAAVITVQILSPRVQSQIESPVPWQRSKA